MLARDKLNMTLEIRGKPGTVAIEGVKPVVTSNQSTKPTVEKADQGTTEQATTVTEQSVHTMRYAKNVALEILKDRSRKNKTVSFHPHTRFHLQVGDFCSVSSFIIFFFK